MRIDVTPGDVQVASVEVRRHTGGIYSVQILTPHERRAGCIAHGSVTGKNDPRSQMVYLYAFEPGLGVLNAPTRILFTPESNDEEEAFLLGLFDVLDDWSRYTVALIAIPASVLEEAEEAGSWEPQGPVDYLAT